MNIGHEQKQQNKEQGRQICCNQKPEMGKSCSSHSANIVFIFSQRPKTGSICFFLFNFYGKFNDFTNNQSSVGKTRA